MNLVATPHPHFIPGYTGHCPQYTYRAGKTYGQLTHKLLIDPCIRHSPKLIVQGPNETKRAIDHPTPREIDLIKTHEQEGDAVFRHPIVPGYEGFIPNLTSKIGDRFLVAATAGIAEHEEHMQRLKCEARKLKHRDLLEGGRGLYERKLGDRLLAESTYRMPLIPVRSPVEGVLRKTKEDKHFAKPIKEVPYSRNSPPHFMENGDPDKFVVTGYGGHVPLASSHFGLSNKTLTNSALCEFTNNYHHRKSPEWVPVASTGVGTSLPNTGTFVIYHRNIGLVPNYAGHVPGEAFRFGRTFGNNTVNAKRWLEENFVH